MLRRLHPEQPDGFAFSPANQAWAEAQMTKFPEGRQASAIIPLLWRAQEQEGWLSRPAIEHIADMLGMAYIRALEVATFYFMFQLTPTGSVAHIQVCGTTSCMICGAEDLIGICREKIADKPHTLSADGKFTWEEVECLGACANAPMAQIGKDYYEDLTGARFTEMLEELAAGQVPVPGPQNGRYAAEPLSGLTSLTEYESGRTQYNASVQRAVDLGDTVKRIDGTEVPLRTPWKEEPAVATPDSETMKQQEPRPAAGKPADATGTTEQEARATETGHPQADATGNDANAETGPVAQRNADATTDGDGTGDLRDDAASAASAAERAANLPPEEKSVSDADVEAAGEGTRPEGLSAAREGGPDDLKMIKGVGPKLETLLHDLGFYHFDQISRWGAAEVAWVNQNLAGFKGRVSRDNWVDQARVLASGGATEFSSRVKKGDVY
ncbi:NADH-quinone oxidoreductase subunit E [Pseudooceanicola aestuarii]|uniref:NADH-quinone oxidoreductase subunit E n=1 Tax=Pseudooceanicola aestuarii TaxID=2697319 RepID=UPI0013D246BC|nr:NADH-quinone oxidoreductase subunit E [Pseudooceanicola aestuarii]